MTTNTAPPQGPVSPVQPLVTAAISRVFVYIPADWPMMPWWQVQ